MLQWILWLSPTPEQMKVVAEYVVAQKFITDTPEDQNVLPKKKRPEGRFLVMLCGKY